MATILEFSIGQSDSEDMKDSSGTITIVSGVASFSDYHFHIGIGAGNKVTHTGGDLVCYLVEKTNGVANEWNVQLADGTVPQDVTAQTLTSITHPFASASAANAGAGTLIGTSNLVTGDYILRFPMYYNTGHDTTPLATSGYTTDATRYIEYYAPYDIKINCNVRQRHIGKWSDRLPAIVVTASGNGQNCIDIGSQDNVKLTGLQVKMISSTYTGSSIIDVGSSGVAGIGISDCICVGTVTTGNFSDGGIYSASSSNVITLKNNTVYGCTGTGSAGISMTCSTVGIYNCTVADCTLGIERVTGTATVTNCAVFNNGTDFSGSMTISYCASDADSGTNSVDLNENAEGEWDASFTDWATHCYTIKCLTSPIANVGTDLSGSGVTKDSRGVSRPTYSGYDIGAFECVSSVFLSVGQNTSDHKEGTPTITIAGLVLTFSVPQDGTTTGAGDKVTHAGGDGSCYLVRKVGGDASVWIVTTATGGVPTAVTTQSVTSITHVFASMITAEAGTGSIVGSESLITEEIVVHHPLYNDGSADSSRTAWDGRTGVGWETDELHNINIYTPYDTSTECNLSQRHNGVWTTAAHRFERETTGGYQKIMFYNGYYNTYGGGFFRFDGLQMYTNNIIDETAAGIVSETANGNGHIVVSNCICKASGTTSKPTMLYNTRQTSTWDIYNNICYGVNAEDASYGVWIYGNYSNVFNNTISRCDKGIRVINGGLVYNNVVFDNDADFLNINNATFHDYNASDNDPSETNWVDLNGNAGGEWDAAFTDYANNDYSVKNISSLLYDAGTDIVSQEVEISSDIIRTQRPQGAAFDIGAFEYLLEVIARRIFITMIG